MTGLESKLKVIKDHKGRKSVRVTAQQSGMSLSTMAIILRKKVILQLKRQFHWMQQD